MRIALYGDSFGTGLGKASSLPTAWYNILAEKLGAELDNYSAQGTSVYYSYDKFLKTYHKGYDMVIFLVTEPNRYTKEVNLTSSPEIRFIPSLVVVESILNNSDFTAILAATDIETLNHVRSWFIMSDEYFAATATGLMLADVENKFPNVIFYPCFPNSLTTEQLEKDRINPKYTMYDISVRSRELLGLSNASFFREKDTISAHLSHEFNAFVANVMYNRICTGIWNWEGFDEIRPELDKYYYYEKIWTPN